MRSHSLIAMKTIVKAEGAGTYLSVHQAAMRTSVSRRTVKRWINAGYLSAIRLPSPKGLGHLRIRLAELEALMARGTQR